MQRPLANPKAADWNEHLNHVQFENRSLSWVEVTAVSPKVPIMGLKLDVV